MTLNELTRRFPDEDSAKAHLFNLRWQNGAVACPRCKATEKIYRRKPKAGEAVSYRWVCKSCHKSGYGFSLTTGTIFEDTKIPLQYWFQVLLLMLSSKKGMSALQIQRTVFGQVERPDGKIAGKGSYETTWYMCHRLRAAMQDGTFQRLTGIVEVDETYVGGKESNKHRRDRLNIRGGKGGKYAVVGAIARKGNVVCKVIERASSQTIQGFVTKTVDENVSLIATDESPAYHGLTLKHGLPHQTVNHTDGEYVRGVVHTANLDSFWSLIKRGIMGSYHKVSWGYLPLYVNEFAYRHNARGAFNAQTFDRVLESC